MVGNYEKSLQHALIYQRMGMNVVPAIGKRPAIKWKHLEKKRLSYEEVKALFSKYRGANIALITGEVSKIVVVDVDDREKYADLVEELEKIETWKSQTKRGVHYFFATDREYPSVKKQGLDFKAEGGIVILPYSRHPDDPSIEYRWLHAFTVKPGKLLKGTQPIPRTSIYPPLYPFEKLSDSIKRIILSNEEERTESSYNPTFIHTTEGLRNNTLTVFLGTLLAKKPFISEEELLKHAMLINKTFIPPLPEEEVRRTTHSIYKRHTRQMQIVKRIHKVIDTCVNGKGLSQKQALYLAAYVKYVSSSCKEFFHLLLKTGLYWHIPRNYRKNLSKFYETIKPLGYKTILTHLPRGKEIHYKE